MALPTAIPFSALSMSNRMAIRSEPNPYDRATIFSIYPREVIDDTKITIQPNIFIIPAGTYDNPGRLIVEPASWWRDIDPEQPLLEIPVPSIQLADSIVRDKVSHRLGASIGEAQPGLFYLPGEITVAELKSKYQLLLDKANARQLNWYQSLVKMADALWARTNGNPLSIDDSMRLAAKEMHLERPWLSTFRHVEMTPCIACGTLRNPTFPICPHCKNVVDKDKAEKLGLIFAK